MLFVRKIICERSPLRQKIACEVSCEAQRHCAAAAFRSSWNSIYIVAVAMTVKVRIIYLNNNIKI